MVAVAVLAAMGTAGVAPAHAAHGLRDRKHNAKKQVQVLEEQWRAARLAGDAATMDKMLSDDYIGISMTGQVSTKAQQLERTRNRKLVLTRIDLADMQVKLIGGIAIVTSRAEIEGTNEGVAVSGTYRYTRVYRHTPGDGWKITSFEATRVPKGREALDGSQGNDAKISRDRWMVSSQ